MDRRSGAWFQGWLVTKKGADTSGNWRHRGTPGSVGGSLPGGGHGLIGIGADTPPAMASDLVHEYRKNQVRKRELEEKMRKAERAKPGEAPAGEPKGQLPPEITQKESKFTAKDLRGLNREWGHKIRQWKRRVDQVVVWLKGGWIGRPEVKSRIGDRRQVMQAAQERHDKKMKEFMAK